VKATPVPATVRAQIERARVQVERLLTEAEAEPAIIGDSRGGFFVSLHPGRRRIIPTTLTLVAAIVDALTAAARENTWAADRLSATVEREIDKATSRIHRAFELSPPATLEAFRRDVARGARAAPWWRTYQDTLEELSGPPPFHVQLRAALDEAGLTVEQFTERLKRPDPAPIYRNLAGVRPHPKNVSEFEKVLSAAFGRSFQFIQPPRNRKRQ
jgi:hypothetical protein